MIRGAVRHGKAAHAAAIFYILLQFILKFSQVNFLKRNRDNKSTVSDAPHREEACVCFEYVIEGRPLPDDPQCSCYDLAPEELP